MFQIFASMFWKSARELRKAYAALRQFNRRAHEETTKARKEKQSSEFLEELHAEHAFEHQQLYEDLEIASHHYWVEQAGKYLIAISHAEGNWTKTPMGEEHIITAAGREKLRDLVRSEIQFRRERWSLFFSFLATIISIVALVVSTTTGK